jgi:type II secretory pathway component PulF
MFAVAFIVLAAAIAVLTLAAWMAQKFFFNDTAPRRSRWPSTLLASTVITSLILGSIGTFALPAFSNLFTSFGVELNTPTKVLLSARHALWLPAALLLLSLRISNRRFYNTRFLATFQICESFLLLLVLWALYSAVDVTSCAQTVVQ